MLDPQIFLFCVETDIPCKSIIFQNIEFCFQIFRNIDLHKPPEKYFPKEISFIYFVLFLRIFCLSGQYEVSFLTGSLWETYYYLGHLKVVFFILLDKIECIEIVEMPVWYSYHISQMDIFDLLWL